jgi:hypothetical protein
MRYSKRIKIVILIVFTITLYSCTKESEEVKNITTDTTKKNSGGISAGGVDFKVEYDNPRQIYSIENKDLDNNGFDEIIVLSVKKDDPGDQYLDYYNFDLMQVFALDSTGKNYAKISSDTIDYGEELVYDDLLRDFKYQMLVKTNTGGNDVYASKGMFVYDLRSNTDLQMIRYIEFGNPEVKDINSDGKKEIVVTDSYWGIMPRPDIIYYTSAIYSLENGELKRKNSEYRDYFDEKTKAARTKYDDEKSRLQKGEKIKPSEYPLYASSVEIFVNYMSAEDNPRIIAFWNSEKDFIKQNISEDQFTDLENFIARISIVAQNL